ncbi:GNAT family N-acetyltransferase [Paenibacillus sp. B01]|nr:GNAT family N-acetyltransferase [Paenibacillus sp. B01]
MMEKTSPLSGREAKAMFHRRLEGGCELRVLAPADAKALYRTLEKDRRELETWLPWVGQIRSAADMKDYVRFECKRYKEGKAMSAVLLDGASAAGMISFQELDFRHRKASLGYWLGSAWQGRGLMAQAAGEMLSFAYGTLDLNRVEIRARTDNRRSRAVALRLGFSLEGVLREEEHADGMFLDHAVYGLLARDWARGRASTDVPDRQPV